MNPHPIFEESAPLRRTVVLSVLIALLLFNWQPDPRLLGAPALRREEDRPLPEDSDGVETHAARPPRSAHLEAAGRQLPGGRQAARRRAGRRG
jgi:hypothetical protein